MCPRFCLIVSSVLALLACAAEIQANSPAFTMTQYSYGPDPAQVLDLYTPNDVPDDPLPVVVLAHGGLWISGDRGDLEHLCIQIMIQSSAGVACASIDYRLSNNLGGTCTAPGLATYAHQVADMASAFALLQSQAITHGLDTTRFFVGGHSAGGHLAHELNLRWADFAPACANPLGCAAPAGAIGFEGIYDIAAWDAYDATFWNGQYHCVTRQAFGSPAGSPPACIDSGYGLPCWDVGSPTYLASNAGTLGIGPAGDALIIHSPDDDWVDVSEATLFGAAMSAAYPDIHVITSVDGACATGQHNAPLTQASLAQCITDFVALERDDPIPVPSHSPGGVGLIALALIACVRRVVATRK
jgi:acetyl esterase/lipase